MGRAAGLNGAGQAVTNKRMTRHIGVSRMSVTLNPFTQPSFILSPAHRSAVGPQGPSGTLFFLCLQGITFCYGGLKHGYKKWDKPLTHRLFSPELTVGQTVSANITVL